MRITEVTTHQVPVNHRGGWVFVQVRTDAGLTGVGEASHSANDEVCVSLLRRMGEALKGEDPLRIGAACRKLAPLAFGMPGQTALSAVEQALWDLLGQASGMPVHAILGGALRETIPLYANINRGARDRSEECFAARAAQAVAEGFTAVKLAPFDEVHHTRMDAGSLRRAAEPGIRRVAAVREAVGNEVDVLVDCHSRFDVPTARAVARELAGLGIFWFEEPVARHPVSLLREVRDAVPMPVAAGEEFYGLEGFHELVATRACDFLMPDVKHCGGLGEARKIAALAEAFGIPVTPHNPAGPVSTAASVHLCAVLPNFWRLEYQWGEVEWRKDLVQPAEQVVNGCLKLPDAPGLGVGLHPVAVSR